MTNEGFRYYIAERRDEMAETTETTEAPETDTPTDLFLCESEALILREGLYRFTVDPNCDRCRELARIGEVS
jgi:hypothetical protein